MATLETELKINILPFLDSEECPRIEVLNLKPGDVLVLKANAKLSDEAAERCHMYLSRAFPGVSVVVLEQGMELQVVRP